MRQMISLLLAGMLLLAACSASGAETMEPAAEYEEPRYRFEDLTAKETFTAEDGTEIASYDYRLFTLAVDNLEALSPEDLAAAERNVESFNLRAREVLEDSVAYGREVAAMAEEIWADTDVWPAGYEDGTVAQGYMGGEIICVRTDTWGYTGGAHGYSYTTGYTFDLSTGQFIDPVQLADDPAAFQKGAAELLIEKADSGESGSRPGDYWDDYQEIIRSWSGGVTLFDENGMVVVYAPYELGPYAIGEVSLHLRYEEIAGLLGPGGLARLGVEEEN